MLTDFIKGKFVYNCQTEEDAKDLLNKLSELGKMWSSGSSLSSYVGWNIYESRTCYYCNPIRCNEKNSVTYSAIEHFEISSVPVKIYKRNILLIELE